LILVGAQADGLRGFLDRFAGHFYNPKKMDKPAKKHSSRSFSLISFVLIVLLVTSPQNSSGQELAFKLKVVAEQANIRLEPDIASVIIRQVPQGTILESTGKEGEWHTVKLTSREGAIISGYVHESLVVMVEPFLQQLEKPKKIKEEDKQKDEITAIPLEQERHQILSPPDIGAEKSRQTQFPRFDMTLFGGGIYVDGGDFNKGALGLVDFYSDILGIVGEGDLRPVHYGYILGGELSIRLSSRLSLGIGVDFFQGKMESLLDFSKDSLTRTIITRPKLSAIPVGITVSFTFLPELYIKGGISYSFAECSYFYHIQEEEFPREWQGNANAQEFGLLGGLGFMKDITPHLSLVAEVSGHYAKIDGFKGKDTFQDPSGQTLTEEGILYLIQAEASEQRSYPLLFIRETKPNEAGVIDAREAKIDFSGISLKVGFRIRL